VTGAMAVAVAVGIGSATQCSTVQCGAAARPQYSAVPCALRCSYTARSRCERGLGGQRDPRAP